MEIATHRIQMSEVARSLTVRIEVVGLMMFKLRVMVGLWVVRLGVWITGMNCVIEQSSNQT